MGSEWRDENESMHEIETWIVLMLLIAGTLVVLGGSLLVHSTNLVAAGFVVLVLGAYCAWSNWHMAQAEKQQQREKERLRRQGERRTLSR